MDPVHPRSLSDAACRVSLRARHTYCKGIITPPKSLLCPACSLLRCKLLLEVPGQGWISRTFCIHIYVSTMPLAEHCTAGGMKTQPRRQHNSRKLCFSLSLKLINVDGNCRLGLTDLSGQRHRTAVSRNRGSKKVRDLSQMGCQPISSRLGPICRRTGTVPVFLRSS